MFVFKYVIVINKRKRILTNNTNEYEWLKNKHGQQPNIAADMDSIVLHRGWSVIHDTNVVRQILWLKIRRRSKITKLRWELRLWKIEFENSWSVREYEQPLHKTARGGIQFLLRFVVPKAVDCIRCL